MHDRDQEVARLRAEGYRYRAIAKIQGMSLAGVQRALQRAEKVPLDLDDDNDALDTLHLDEEDDEPMRPLTRSGSMSTWMRRASDSTRWLRIGRSGFWCFAGVTSAGTGLSRERPVRRHPGEPVAGQAAPRGD